MSEKIDEIVYEEIKAAKSDGLTSKDCADEMDLELSEVNKIYASTSYQEYSGKKSKTSIVDATKADYYRSLLARKEEDKDNLQGTKGYLLEQVSFLRKSVAFLELRKRELEDGIKNLEKQVRVGIDAMQTLEDNNNFKK